jgi:hypothetical protein
MGNLVKLCRAGDRALQLLLFNEEFLVSVSHQLALITSLPFVHTARRYYRLNGHGNGLGSLPKVESNGQKSSGDNENAILWTPLLITFAQTDMVGP